jgi:hypothetical protein
MLKSELDTFCSESQGDPNGIKSRFLSCFVPEIIGVENREISRNPNSPPPTTSLLSVYSAYKKKLIDT